MTRYEASEKTTMPSSTIMYSLSGSRVLSDHRPKTQLPSPRPRRKTATTVATAKLLTPKTRPSSLIQINW